MNVVKKGVILLLECLAAIEVLICVGEIPILFENLGFHLSNYFHSVSQYTAKFFTLQAFSVPIGTAKVSIFSILFERYIDSMEILGLGIIVAGIIAFIMAYLTLILFRRKISVVKKLMELAESIPDLIFILLLQMLVIFVYKKTGVRFANVVSLNEKAILLPVISMAVPISFYIAKVMILSIEEELGKEYVTLVKSKGFSNFYILNRHVLRNIVEELFITSKTVIWTMLSTLVIVDRLFNMNALMSSMLEDIDSFIIGCMLLFIPFFLLYRIFDWVGFTNRKDSN